MIIQNGHSPIKAVFFDIGNVLLKFDSRLLVFQLAKVAGYRPLHMARALWNGSLVDSIERGEISSSQLFRFFQKNLGFQGDFKKFRKIWCSHFSPDKAAISLLKRVTRSHRVYLLSNTNHLHYEFIRKRYAFVRHVDGALLSYQLGMRKPELRIYVAALKRARVRPQESVFIDDLKMNVKAAQSLGIQALHYTGMPKLSRDLRKLGVLG